MRLRFLGVRGSSPAPGAEFARYGGHTSCVAVSHDGEEPTLVLDAGTGIRMLSPVLSGEAFRGTIMLSHLHWDHLQGLPFFAKGDRLGAEVDLFLPAQDGASARDLLARMLAPPYFPILPEGLQGTWRFRLVHSAAVETAGFEVVPVDVEHKGGRTLGYRVRDGSGSVAYVPDHAAVSRTPSLAEHLRGVDVLIHDSQFLDQEREVAGRFGHSTVGDSIELAAEVGARTLVLFHHSPARTDDELDALAAALDAPLPVLVAHEGMSLDVGPPGD